MKPRVVWENMPTEHRKAFEPYVRRYLPSLPCWVELLTVTYNNDPPAEPGDVVYLEVSAQEEMREVSLFYRPAWLECDDTAREEKVSHEFAHVPWLPAADIADRVLRDTSAPRALVEQWEKRVEAATQDAARSLRAAYGA